MDKNEVLDYIENANDMELMVLQEAITAIRQERRNKAARKLAATLSVGDKVRIKAAGIKPRYLGGQTGTITEFKNSRVSVRLDRGPQGKFYNGIVLCPLTALEAL